MKALCSGAQSSAIDAKADDLTVETRTVCHIPTPRSSKTASRPHWLTAVVGEPGQGTTRKLTMANSTAISIHFGAKV